MIVLAAAVGCSSVPGTPVRAPGGPPPGAVDIGLLGPGNFPTEPVPPLGNAGSPPEGALIDARRMASYVVGPWVVDSTLVTPGSVRALVLKDAAAVGVIEPSGEIAAARAHNLINGFASDRQGLNQQRLMNAVLRFADPGSAAAAAADMARAATAAQPGPSQPLVSIPGHPDALASTYSFNAFGGDQHPVTVVSYTPHGAYVLCQTAQADQVDAAAALIAKTLDVQGPRIDQFSPTDPAEFADLPIDPTGLLAHTMPAPNWPEPKDSGPTNPKIGIYQPDAALHFQDDPVGAAAALFTAGVSAMSYNQTLVYRARDPAAAAQLAQDLPDLIQKQQSSAVSVGGVDFMPTSRCVESERRGGNGKSQYSCYAPVDALTIEVHAADATGARQETAAQYKMLLTK